MPLRKGGNNKNMQSCRDYSKYSPKKYAALWKSILGKMVRGNQEMFALTNPSNLLGQNGMVHADMPLPRTQHHQPLLLHPMPNAPERCGQGVNQSQKFMLHRQLTS